MSSALYLGDPSFCVLLPMLLCFMSDSPCCPFYLVLHYEQVFFFFHVLFSYPKVQFGVLYWLNMQDRGEYCEDFNGGAP